MENFSPLVTSSYLLSSSTVSPQIKALDIFVIFKMLTQTEARKIFKENIKN